MIRVLVVDDSKTACEILVSILKSVPEIEITGVASSGEEALSMIKLNRPDVITMDINMPGIDGFETTKRIMETTPLPIIIVSSSYKMDNLSLSFRAMEAGALAIIEKPVVPGNPKYEKNKNELIRSVKQMSHVKTVIREKKITAVKAKNEFKSNISLSGDVDIIAVGASTGGPVALRNFLTNLNTPVRTPILIVQHISSGFTAGFADWLSKTCGLNVKLPVNGEKITGDTVYVAPDDIHMGVDRSGCIVLSGMPPIKNLKPAVAYLFRSVAESYGPRAIGVLLTGMGRDGADELKLMRDKGAMTFAQDEESSIVFGMPGEAVKIGGAVCVLPPEEIAVRINDILQKQKRSKLT